MDQDVTRKVKDGKDWLGLKKSGKISKHFQILTSAMQSGITLNSLPILLARS